MPPRRVLGAQPRARRRSGRRPRRRTRGPAGRVDDDQACPAQPGLFGASAVAWPLPWDAPTTIVVITRHCSSRPAASGGGWRTPYLAAPKRHDRGTIRRARCRVRARRRSPEGVQVGMLRALISAGVAPVVLGTSVRAVTARCSPPLRPAERSTGSRPCRTRLSDDGIFGGSPLRRMSTLARTRTHPFQRSAGTC